MACLDKCSQTLPPVPPNPGGGGSNQSLASSPIVSGEMLPQLPNWNPNWNVEDYKKEIENFHIKLLEYLRRLSGKVALENAANPGGGGTPGVDPGVLDVVTEIFYDPITHRLMQRKQRIKAAEILQNLGLFVAFAPTEVEQVVTDVNAVDGGLQKSVKNLLYVFEQTGETQGATVATCFKACAGSAPCPDIAGTPIEHSWTLEAKESYVFELDTNNFTSFSFLGNGASGVAESDDVCVLIKDEDEVTVDVDPTTYTVTIPAKHVLFQDNVGHIGKAGRDAVFTDGTNTFTVLVTDDPDNGSNPNRRVSGFTGFTSQTWATAVTSAQLLALGMVDGDGIARLKFAGGGDAGGMWIRGITCTP